MATLEERAAAMQLKYQQAYKDKNPFFGAVQGCKDIDAEDTEGPEANNNELSFVDESKITFNADEGFSSLGEEDDEDDDAAEAEAIELI